MIGAANFAQILGVEARRERGRADEIAEDHGQLAPLGLGYSKASRRGRRPCCGGTSITTRQIGDRLLQQQAMADCADPKLFEIVDS